jgi:hypothetical protein
MKRYIVFLLFIVFNIQAQTIIPINLANAEKSNRILDTVRLSDLYHVKYIAVLDSAISDGLETPENDENLINSDFVRRLDSLNLEFDRLYKFTNNTSEDFGLRNYASNIGHSTIVGDVEYSPQLGFRPNASGAYLRTHFIPDSNASHFKADSFSFGAYIQIQGSTIDGDWAMGSRESTPNPDIDLVFRASGTARFSDATSAVFSSFPASSNNFIVFTRKGTTRKIFLNGEEIHSSTAVITGLSRIEHYILAANLNGSAGGPCSHDFLGAFYGSYISDSKQEKFYEIWKTAVEDIQNLEPKEGNDSPDPIDPPPPVLTEGQLRLSHKMVLSNAPTVPVQSKFLFDGITNTNDVFSGGFISMSYELIDGTGLTGHTLIIDLHGKCYVEALKIKDGTGSPTVDIWIGKKNMFELDSITRVNLDTYLGTKTVTIDDTIRYIILNRSAIITGINEIQAFGVRIDTVEEFHPELPNVPVKQAWSINTHDYDHRESVDSVFRNIFDINPFAGSRTYVEMNKTINTDNSLNKFGAVGALEIDQIQKFQARGGKLMISPIKNLNQFTSTYPTHTPIGEEPYMYWDTTLTTRQNKELQTNPATWDTMRAIYVRMAEWIVEQPNRLDTVVIFSPWNEWDKTWWTTYHNLTPHAAAAALSMVYDGHEGQYGNGIKDVAPEMIVAGPALAFNNPGYVKMMRDWFYHNRSDSLFPADMICFNSYCNNRSGFQHDPNAYSIPPEGTEWLESIEEMAALGASLGIPVVNTETGADAALAPWNLNRVYISEETDSIFSYHIDGSGDSAEYIHDSIVWPMFDSLLLARQANYNLRYLLTGAQYAKTIYLYHIRDNNFSDTYLSQWVNAATYSSSGIAWRVDASVALGNLLLKPSGELVTEFYNELKDYTLTNTTVVGETWTQTYTNSEGGTKQVQWTSDWDSRPVILE